MSSSLNDIDTRLYYDVSEENAYKNCIIYSTYLLSKVKSMAEKLLMDFQNWMTTKTLWQKYLSRFFMVVLNRPIYIEQAQSDGIENAFWISSAEWRGVKILNFQPKGLFQVIP